MELFVFTAAYLIAFFTGRYGLYLLSAGILMITGAVLFVFYLKREKSILAPPALFSLSWIFCIGISACKLSSLQTDWTEKTWLCFYLIFAAFILFWKLGKKSGGKHSLIKKQTEINGNELFGIIIAFTLISVCCFVFEAVRLGFIPLFTEGIPHAYSTFHISGVHYFTVLCVLVPSISVLLIHKTDDRRRIIISLFCDAVCFSLPIFMVSRFQLLFSVGLAAIMWFFLHQHDLRRFLHVKYVIPVCGAVVLLIGMYVFITMERAHSVEYLNSIFEMKDPSTPIFITQPYIYVANNFDNFDCLVRELDGYTHGLRIAYPAFALTGLKFRFPELVSFPLYVTKEELTTVTMFYDAYYDFGPAGCAVFAAILGFLYARLYRIVNDRRSDMVLIIYTQLTVYLALAFFTTWFSNPTTWFYIGICILTDLILIILRKYGNQPKKGTL